MCPPYAHKQKRTYAGKVGACYLQEGIIIVSYVKVKIMNSFGENLKITISGELSSPCVLVTLDGLPAGLPLDWAKAWRDALRRAPSAAEGGERASESVPALICGMRDGATSGGPVSALLRTEEDTPRVGSIPRPGHEDLAALSKYGASDFSGGAYSGRLDTALAFAGALCVQLLRRRNIQLETKVVAIGGAEGDEQDFDLKKQLLDARGTGDSMGGVVECRAAGLPSGLGSPAFGGLESRISALLFAIPGIKGVEFGLGFGFAAMRGSAANDQIILEDKHIIPETNNSGGVDVGISTGAPLTVRAALRPTPSVGREQRSVDTDTLEAVTLRQRGRHEPCMAPRCIPAVEGAVAICIVDAMMDPDLKRRGKEWK